MAAAWDEIEKALSSVDSATPESVATATFWLDFLRALGDVKAVTVPAVENLAVFIAQRMPDATNAQIAAAARVSPSLITRWVAKVEKT